VRVDSKRLRVIENKTMRVKSTRVRVETALMRVVKKKQQKAKHGAGACRSKVYVYDYMIMSVK
jgi:hypothetical protein